MSQLIEVLKICGDSEISKKNQFLGFILNMIESIKKNGYEPSAEDCNAVLTFSGAEAELYLKAIEEANSYRAKDVIFECGGLLIRIVMSIFSNPQAMDEKTQKKIGTLHAVIEKERYIENALAAVFDEPERSESSVKSLISMLSKISDEYQKGRFYAGLVFFNDKTEKLSEASRSILAEYIEGEAEHYLNMHEKDQDIIENLELIADIAKHFGSERLIFSLYDFLKLEKNNINYFAIDTLLQLGKEIPADAISSLAEDLEYASLTYYALKANSREELFPAAYRKDEYLAKSDLVHWLVYPTELGMKPDEIEYIGEIKYLLKREKYYVFRYRSQSPNLDDSLRGKWLIGWSCENGETFSNFDEYALYEKKNTKATLKSIKRFVIG